MQSCAILGRRGQRRGVCSSAAYPSCAASLLDVLLEGKHLTPFQVEVLKGWRQKDTKLLDERVKGGDVATQAAVVRAIFCQQQEKRWDTMVEKYSTKVHVLRLLGTLALPSWTSDAMLSCIISLLAVCVLLFCAGHPTACQRNSRGYRGNQGTHKQRVSRLRRDHLQLHG
jgi:hypothetical protein